MALVDERGCRRDIRSNGWIDFRQDLLFQKGSLFQNRSGRRNRFSSFGAESLLRNFTGPKARMKSGPDVFADALVPRNVSVPWNVSIAAPLGAWRSGISISFMFSSWLPPVPPGHRHGDAPWPIRPRTCRIDQRNFCKCRSAAVADLSTRVRRETSQWLSFCQTAG